MATGLDHPFSVAADESNVYWVEYGGADDTNGSVKSCPITGCGAGPTVYAELQAAPRALISDGQNVYWGTISASAINGAIWSCPIAGCGGSPTKIASADTPFGIAVDSKNVYWAEFYQQTVNRAPKAGGTAALVYDGGGTNTELNGPSLLVMDTSFIYINDQNDDVYRVPLGGGDLVSMYMNGSPEVGVFGLAVDSSDVYIGNLGGIFHMSKTAASGAKALVPNLTDVVDLKVDPAGGVVYWADFGSAGNDGTVGKIALAGGAPTLLHQSLATPEAVAVNSTYVFWLSNGTLQSDGVTVTDGTGVLYRTAK